MLAVIREEGYDPRNPKDVVWWSACDGQDCDWGFASAGYQDVLRRARVHFKYCTEERT